MTDKEALKIYRDRKRKERKNNIAEFFHDLPESLLTALILILAAAIWVAPVILGGILENRFLTIIGGAWALFVLVVIIILAIVSCIKDKLRQKKMEIEYIKEWNKDEH